MDKEHLKVLDMSEDEQIKCLIEKGVTDGGLAISQVTNKIVPHWIRIELADLALKLRDEAVPLKYHEALMKVYRYRCKHSKKTPPQITFGHWLVEYIKSIDMIIAALIAKGDDIKVK